MVSIKRALVGIMSVAAVMAGSSDNSIVTPGWGQTANANDVLKITWNPTTSGNVNLVLRQGGSQDLTTLYTIASNIANSGSYTWNIPANQGTNTDYSIEIVPVDNSDESNFSPYFTILGVGQGITSSSAASGSATSTDSQSSVASSASASASGTSSDSTSSATTSGSASASATDSSSTDSATSSGATTGSSLSTKAKAAVSTSAQSSAATSAATTSASASKSAATGAAAVQPVNAAVALGAALGAVVLATL
ncbi:putative GPI anchored protein [Sugiyamaella lignohabitans]|uniref:Putative GPI anchored protein n=1 Tax=Sugiyamaella lignohabitans TaxID=796027 RepID=A0A161HNQ9_9ASCO|nr:putative GPI anchored protein [Sugiyamaella lignohabitans]ANB15827.1 putative GPI anchored protein [Sugiyamaella lignohabitans]